MISQWQTFLRVIFARWWRKPASIDMDRNYVTVTHSVKTYYADNTTQTYAAKQLLLKAVHLVCQSLIVLLNKQCNNNDISRVCLLAIWLQSAPVSPLPTHTLIPPRPTYAPIHAPHPHRRLINRLGLETAAAHSSLEM